MRSPTFKLLAIAGVPLLIAGLPMAAHYWIKAAEVRRWEQMRTRLLELAEAMRARETKRPVLRGESVPGNAWEDYEAAFQSVGKASDLYPAGNYLDGDLRVSRYDVVLLLVNHRDALAAIRKGASRERMSRPIYWEAGLPKFNSSAYPLSALADIQARFLAEDGRQREALELLLDTAQYGLDFGRNVNLLHFYVGLGIVNTAMDELRGLFLSDELSREDLEEADRELKLLEDNFPKAAEDRLDVLSSGFTFLRERTLAGILKYYEMRSETISTWRFGFSERLVIVDAFETADSADRRIRQAKERPWKESAALQEMISREFATDGNSLVRRVYGPYDGKVERPARDPFRESLVRLRLIRLAVHHAATGELLELDDPFGDKLQSSRTSDELKLWSIGGNGIDDLGEGEWKPARTKDVVLKVPLRKK